MRLAHEAAVYFPLGDLILSGSMPRAGGITFFMIMRPKVASCEYIQFCLASKFFKNVICV